MFVLFISTGSHDNEGNSVELALGHMMIMREALDHMIMREAMYHLLGHMINEDGSPV